MGRTKDVIWTYSCDDPDHEWSVWTTLEVRKGERCNTRRGTTVETQADADEVARATGWTVSPKGLRCPQCKSAQEATS